MAESMSVVAGNFKKTRWNASRIEASGEDLRLTICFAMFSARALTQSEFIIISDCSGVVVAFRFAVDELPSGASKSERNRSCEFRIDRTNIERTGCNEFCDTPPCEALSSPVAVNIESRICSASSLRGANRHSHRLLGSSCEVVLMAAG